MATQRSETGQPFFTREYNCFQKLSANRSLRTVLVILCWILVVLLSLYSVRNAALYSGDFQWSGARALLHGRNPYLEYLGPEKNTFFIKFQAPNYLQFLYILLLPFASMPEVAANILWGFCNVAMLGVSAALLLGYMGVPKCNGLNLAFIMLLMLSSFPARNAIGNGQASIFVLFCFVSGVCILGKDSKSSRYGLFMGPLVYGLGYAKYSFAPAFAAFLFNLKNIRSFLLSLLPAVFGAMVFAFMFRDQYAINGPLQVSSQTMVGSAGLGDLLALIIFMVGAISPDQFRFIGYLLILLSVFLVWQYRGIEDKRRFALSAIISLSFVTHLPYDYCFLLIPLVFAFSPASTNVDRFATLLHFIWIGYVVRLIYATGVSLSWTWVTPVTFMANIALICILALPALPRGLHA